MASASKVLEIAMVDDPIASAIERACQSLLSDARVESNNGQLEDASAASELFINLKHMSRLLQNQEQKKLPGGRNLA